MMKFLKSIALFFVLISCSNIELVDYWKNENMETYSPSKTLIVCITSNQEARQNFEAKLKENLQYRGIESVRSLDYLNTSFTSERITEEEFKKLENNLINDGFDTVLLTKLISVETKIDYNQNYKDYDSTYVKFKEDFLKYQDAFYNPDYYIEYNIYHTETSMYCICPDKKMDLILKAKIDITDPQMLEETINDYVKLMLIVLEEEQFINTVIIEDDKKDDPII